MKTIIFFLTLLLAGGIQQVSAQYPYNDFTVIVPGDTLTVAKVTAFTNNPVRTKFADVKEIQLRLEADSTLYFVDGQDSLSGDLIHNVEKVVALSSNWGGDGKAVLLIKMRGYTYQLLMLEVHKGQIGAINFGMLPSSLMEIDLKDLVLMFRDDYQMVLMNHYKSTEGFQLVLQGDRLEGYCMHW